MISIEEARNEMGRIAFNPEIELVSLFDLTGRVLAEEIVSKINMPPFDKSAMDGYAFSSKDKSEKFKIIEIIAAGKLPLRKLGIGECSKIMTGAAIPAGADRVLKVELTKEEDGYMIPTGKEPVKNICYIGEDIEKGDIILKKGVMLDAAPIGLIASMGLDKVKVYKKPVIGLITTGTEIIEPGLPLEDGQIYNSNAYSLYIQLTKAGAIVRYAGIIGDDREKTKEIISNTVANSDMLIISGGVSMGDFDFVPEVLKEIGIKIHFDRVAIKPGKPTTYGTIDNKVIFGLPGNPVSTFVITEVFVKNMLYRMMAYEYNPFLLSGVLKNGYKRGKSGRASYIPVIYKNGLVSIPDYHGSAHLGAMADANALLLIDKGVNEIIKGAKVDVRQI